jgi:hypothetical protein
MQKIKSFGEFLNEKQFDLSDPSTAGDVLAGVIAANGKVKEQPKGANSGPEVNRYLKSVGLDSGLPWCAAFVYYIFSELSRRLNQPNPLPKTGGVMQHWSSAPADVKIDIAKARSNPNLIKPGQIFIMSRPGRGLGHTGIVIGVDPSKGTFTSIEGNTNDQQSGEGDRVGVNTRRVNSKNMIGFLDYFKNERTPEFEADIKKSVDPRTLALPPLDGVPSDDVVGGGPLGSATQRVAKPGDHDRDKGFLGSFFSGMASFLGKSNPDYSVGEIKDIMDKVR